VFTSIRRSTMGWVIAIMAVLSVIGTMVLTIWAVFMQE